MDKFIASNGYTVERLSDGQTKLSRRVSSSSAFEFQVWCNKDEYDAIAEHSRWDQAHKDTAPWHEAKPGEIWVLKLNSYREDIYRCSADLPVANEDRLGFVNVIGENAPGHLGMYAPAITAGRRIWPVDGEAR